MSKKSLGNGKSDDIVAVGIDLGTTNSYRSVAGGMKAEPKSSRLRRAWKRNGAEHRPLLRPLLKGDGFKRDGRYHR